METKYIIQDLNDEYYSYNSSGCAFTWKYDLIRKFDSRDEAQRHLNFILARPPNGKRHLVVVDNIKLLRKEKLDKINDKN